MIDSDKPILVATFGNPDAGDDSLGSAVAARLAACNLPLVHIIDLSYNLGALLYALHGRKQLIVVDAAMIPDRPAGAIVDIDWFAEAPPMLCHDRTLTTHGWAVIDQLSLAATLNLLPPRVRLIVMAIESTDIGEPPSRLLGPGAECIVQRVLQWQQRLVSGGPQALAAAVFEG